MPLWNARWETLMPAARRPMTLEQEPRIPPRMPLIVLRCWEMRLPRGGDELVGSGGLETATGAAAAVAPVCPVCRVYTIVPKSPDNFFTRAPGAPSPVHWCVRADRTWCSAEGPAHDGEISARPILWPRSTVTTVLVRTWTQVQRNTTGKGKSRIFT